jgi:hypothetical protein
MHLLQGVVEIFFKGYIVKHIFAFAKNESFKKKNVSQSSHFNYWKKNMFFFISPMIFGGIT